MQFMLHRIIISILIIAASILHAPASSRAGQHSGTSPQPEHRTISPALATTVAAAMAGHKAKKILLLDVRRESLFEQYRIPGSINIPLYAIKTKPYLRFKPIVLVNNGYALKPLVRTCRSLNQAGFHATIMSGGLVAWKAKGGRIIGDPFAQREMNRVPPQIYLQEKGYAHQMIIEAADGQSAQGRPTGMVSLLKDPDGIGKVKRIIRKKSSDPFFSLLIIAGTERENDHIQRKLAAAGICQAFYLQGGRQGYERYQQFTALSQRPKQERTVRTDGCNSCTRQ